MSPIPSCPVQIVFICVVVVLYLVLYRPIVHNMDVTVKRSRAMLLLFPGEVVHSVAAIRLAMQAYSKSVGSSVT